MCVCILYTRRVYTAPKAVACVLWGKRGRGRERERERKKMLCYMGQADNAVMRYRREGGIGNAIEYRIN